jgi:hypothetical protein
VRLTENPTECNATTVFIKFLDSSFFIQRDCFTFNPPFNIACGSNSDLCDLGPNNLQWYVLLNAGTSPLELVGMTTGGNTAGAILNACSDGGTRFLREVRCMVREVMAFS